MRALLARALVLVVGFSSVAPGVAAEREVDVIRRAIRERGAAWFADETPLTRLAPEERRLRGGARPGDFRSILPRFVSDRAGALPPRLDWRDHGGRSVVTSVKNQGGCGSCWAFSATAVFESAWLLQNGLDTGTFDRAEQDVLSCSHAGSCVSGFTEGALQYIVDKGVSDEACMPYQGLDLACADKCWSWPGRVKRARGSAWVENSVAAMKAALQEGPITACFSVYDDFYSYAGGVYDYVWGGTSAAHSVELIGYDDATQSWTCKNSWGPEWGEHGFFRIRYGAIDFGWCATAVQRNHAPEIPWLPVLQASPGSPLEVLLPVVDVDGDSVFVSANLPASMPGAAVDSESGVLTWTPPVGSEGVYRFVVTATDDWQEPLTTSREVVVSVCGQPCDDGDACTDDLCPGGACEHAWNQAPCDDDGNSCTRDTCLEGACHAELPDGSACDDDANPCTVDTCAAGACVHAAVADGAACPDDGSPCSADVCQAGACVHPQAADGEPCTSDHDDCTSDVCVDGWCLHEPLPEGAPCAFDAGDCWTATCAAGVCSWAPGPDGAPCSDHLGCTLEDVCAAGECRGSPPPDCQDEAPCSVNTCADGPGFVPVPPAFVDVAGTGDDLGLDGDDTAVGPFELGFPLALQGGAPRTKLWVSSNGLVSFGGPVTSPLNDCLPSTQAPNDLVAALWDDLVCSRAAGCRAWLAREGQAPDRVVRVQWSDLAVRGLPGSRLTLQVVLHEGGRIDLEYARLDGTDAASASIGLDGGYGDAGAGYSCGEQRLFAPAALQYDPTVSWRCQAWPEKGTCLVDGACVPEGTVNPANPCEACQPWLSIQGYSPFDGERCDDGDACTFDDLCAAGACAGFPAPCDDPGPCADRWCDGGGGCNESWHDGPCDDGDACSANDACSNGACVGSPEPDGTPCDDGLACTAGDGCRDGACTGDLPPGCDDGLACTIDACLDVPDPDLGTPWACKHAADPTACLIDGACYAPKDANPANPCERCEPGVSTTAWSPIEWQACDDGDPCTFGETCAEGVCAGTGYACTQGGSCRAARCAGDGSCLYDELEGPCDDGNPCTVDDACAAGDCAPGAPAADGTGCDDGTACTTFDACDGGACRGEVPAVCGDGLPCTDDGCVDGPTFTPGGAPFDDVGPDGTPIAITGPDEKPAFFPIGFELPWFDGTRTVAWASPRGFLVLGSEPVLEVPNLYPDATACFPDPAPPNDVVALYWRDLACDPASHCSIRTALRGEAPGRALLVQWTNAHPAWQEGPALTAQVALFETGAIELRYDKLVGFDPKGTFVGLENADGTVGASFACGEPRLAAGTSLRYEPGAAWSCVHPPAEGWCAIDGTCVPDGTPNPQNACEGCRDRATTWLPEQGTPCDDGNPCTTDDVCWLGACNGAAVRCVPGPCELASTCDGAGGCQVTPAEPGAPCGKGACVADVLTGPSTCDQQGACVPAKPESCWPFRCATFTACGTACKGPDECAKDAFCDPTAGLCRAKLLAGEPCDGGKACASGWCTNGFCCAEEGLCCAVDADCPPAPDPISCLDPAHCQSRAVHATCGEGNRCEYALVDDDSACGPAFGAQCGYYANRPCDGAVDQPEQGCVPSCVEGGLALRSLGEGGCDPDARCEEGVCVPLKNDGAACSADLQCGSGHCDHGRCCLEGACCLGSGDCAGAEAARCDNPARCQGVRVEVACTERFTCETRAVDDDTACNASVVTDCGDLADHACSGAADQPFFVCPAGCVADDDCDPGFACIDAACAAPAPEPEPDAGEPAPEPSDAATAERAEAEREVVDVRADVPADPGAEVAVEGGGGCSTGPTRGPGAFAGLALGVLALLGLSRRRVSRSADAP